MSRRQVQAFRNCHLQIAAWAGQVRQSLSRELRALQTSHQDAAFLATVKGDAYQHLILRQPAAGA